MNDLQFLASEKIKECFPSNSGERMEFIKRREGLLVMVESLQGGYFIGRINAEETNHVYFSLDCPDGVIRKVPYSNIKPNIQYTKQPNPFLD